MLNYKWIAKSGKCTLLDIPSLLSEMDSNSCFIAMLSDSFEAGYFDRMEKEKILKSQLLELRVFNEDNELLITRGFMGADFQWRKTSDEGLGDKDYIESKQFIDINNQKESRTLENGNRTILSTVGGTYSLPITESQKRVKVKSYISYDHNGMAKVVDARVCCFTE